MLIMMCPSCDQVIHLLFKIIRITKKDPWKGHPSTLKRIKEHIGEVVKVVMFETLYKAYACNPASRLFQVM